jgi:hypothetical protein
LVDPQQVAIWLNRWQTTNYQIDKLLAAPPAQLGASPDPAVTAYSFDRLVVCDRAVTAQILLANQFHFEHNCAVLSIDGYPENVCETVLTMVRRNPDLMVFAFHDASPDGVNLIHRLRTESRWFPDLGVKIIEVGLLPRQAIANYHRLFIRTASNAAKAAQRLDIATRKSLTTAELAWLDKGNYVELESLPPQKLIQILQRSIAASRAIDSSDNDVMIWSEDGGIYFDGSEGFG